MCIDNFNDKGRLLTRVVRQYYEENKIYEIIYHNIKYGIHPSSLEAFTTIANRCLKRNHEALPLMTEVVQRLEHALECQFMTDVVEMIESNLEYQVSSHFTRLCLHFNNYFNLHIFF